MSELFSLAVRTASERKKSKAMGGGFDIMKKVVKKQRTTKDKNTKKDYTSNGFGIVKKWQEKKQNKPPKETSPQTGDQFDVMRKVVEHPTAIKKESLMAPLEKYPKKKRPRKQVY